MVEESENKAGDAAAGTSQMMKDHSQRNVRKMGWRLWPLRMTLNASVKTAGKRVSRRAQHRNIPQNIWKLWCFFVRLRKSCRTGKGYVFVAWRGDFLERQCLHVHSPKRNRKIHPYFFVAKISGRRCSEHQWRQDVFSVSDTEVRAYGTHWAGKERWQHNTSAPLKGIYILFQEKENKIWKLAPGESLNYLLR